MCVLQGDTDAEREGPEALRWLHMILWVCKHILQIKKWKPKERKDVLQRLTAGERQAALEPDDGNQMTGTR